MSQTSCNMQQQLSVDIGCVLKFDVPVFDLCSVILSVILYKGLLSDKALRISLKTSNVVNCA